MIMFENILTDQTRTENIEFTSPFSDMGREELEETVTHLMMECDWHKKENEEMAEEIQRLKEELDLAAQKQTVMWVFDKKNDNDIPHRRDVRTSYIVSRDPIVVPQALQETGDIPFPER